jgi:hypothetical protein
MIFEYFLHDRPITAPHYLNPSIVMRSNLYLFRETRHLRRAPARLAPAGSDSALASTGAGLDQRSKS